jgi:hypothetical protein
MTDTISFTHILNPFVAKPGSEHEVASRVTWETLRRADAVARQHGIDVDCCAVILPGDEAAVHLPTRRTVYLKRTVQDVHPMRPARLFPLATDLLKLGARESTSSHVIFSNMDIAVQPHFYTALRDLIEGSVGRDVPFTVPRLNIDKSLAEGPLETMYAATGPVGVGYDCFVIPRELIAELDLGTCCIGAPHFDLLLFMALDAASRHRVRSLDAERLTFHLGNDIGWAAMLDYVEHNLSESLGSICRMRSRYEIAAPSAFYGLERGHFRRNALPSSRLMRKLKRIPGVSQLVLAAKRSLGRQF